MTSQTSSVTRNAPIIAISRLEALTDGVFAISITLLAIEIGVPLITSDSGTDLFEAVLDQWPQYAAYAVTFSLIGAYWINHHRMFNLLSGVNHKFLLLNILFLMVIAFIPFPNAVVGEYLLDADLRGVAAGVYGVVMLALAGVFNAVWWYARSAGLFSRDCDPAEVTKVCRSYIVGPVAYGVGLAFTFVAPIVALAIFVLVPVGYFFEGPIGDIQRGYAASDT